MWEGVLAPTDKKFLRSRNRTVLSSRSVDISSSGKMAHGSLR